MTGLGYSLLRKVQEGHIKAEFAAKITASKKTSGNMT